MFCKMDKGMRPKRIGGLGVLDMEYFSRALRLRWMWFQWTDPDRPWVGSEVPCNDVDRQFFRASPRVTMGNGARASFWDSSWLDGRAPRDLAPSLYKLAWRKNRTVREELQDNNWTRGLWRMTTTDEMAELVPLCGLIQQVQLTDQPDEIWWKWTPDGVYSAKSVYEAHFKSSYCTFNSRAIWRAKAEGKHRSFAWLLVQQKILTADKLIARNWPCDPVCPLCDQEQQTAEHLCLHCVFAREVWMLVSGWSNGLVQAPNPGSTLEEWWNTSMQGQSKEMGRQETPTRK
ncbi:hypothetical protein PAHAL_9G208900 [Panicum hallii]|uniref:Reverse transcriptase zinc-binding domain-containing protein n=1 Tax=Panicum hallii TaxID=206008 RepID=A0A2T8I223_9POAL|nr:hypothetical protein PAHAL_9G208900 [Panicum hallii]